MKILGQATVAAPRDQVWHALIDPATLVRAIPGCQQLQEIAPDVYRMTVTAGVAAIKGTYDGQVRISDQRQPEHFVLHASGAGAPGTVSADIDLRLDDLGPEGTRLTYEADATIGGVVGGVGQRMITTVARRTATEFFENVERVLNGPPESEDEATTGAATRTRLDGSAPVYLRPTHGTPGGARPMVAAAVLGAAVSLAGVALGWLLGRRTPRS